MGYNLNFLFRRGIIKRQGNKSLTGTLLEVLQYGLVAWVVGNHQHKSRMGGQAFAFLVNGQYPAIITQWVDNHRRIFSGLDNFIEVADGAGSNRTCQWPVHPNGFIILFLD